MAARFNIFADGTFNYVNDGTDATLTSDSFTYTIREWGFDGTYGTADDLTSTATVTITFAEQSPGVAHRVWYVDSDAAPGRRRHLGQSVPDPDRDQRPHRRRNDQRRSR